MIDNQTFRLRRAGGGEGEGRHLPCHLPLQQKDHLNDIQKRGL